MLDYGVLNLTDEDSIGSLSPPDTPPAKKPKAPSAKNGPSKAKVPKEPKKQKAALNNSMNGDVPHEDPMNVFEDIEEATDHGKKRLSIEQIYQKKSQLEHILLRPDTYIGSVEILEQVCMYLSYYILNKFLLRQYF